MKITSPWKKKPSSFHTQALQPRSLWLTPDIPGVGRHRQGDPPSCQGDPSCAAVPPPWDRHALPHALMRIRLNPHKDPDECVAPARFIDQWGGSDRWSWLLRGTQQGSGSIHRCPLVPQHTTDRGQHNGLAVPLLPRGPHPEQSPPPLQNQEQESNLLTPDDKATYHLQVGSAGAGGQRSSSQETRK